MSDPDVSLSLPPARDPAAFGRVAAFTNGGIALLAAGMHERLQIRERAKIDYGGLLDGHLIAVSLIARAVERTHLRPGKASPSISERLTLFASFIQGMDLGEVAISEGLYLQAAALLKQQMETVAAMNELAKGTRTDKKTPNVSILLWKLNVHYGYIQGAAHMSNNALLRDFYQTEARGSAVPVSVTPRYSRQAALYLHTLEVGVLVQFAVAVGDLLREMYGESWIDEELKFLLQVMQILEDEGAFDEAAPAGGAREAAK